MATQWGRSPCPPLDYAAWDAAYVLDMTEQIPDDTACTTEEWDAKVTQVLAECALEEHGESS